MTETFEEALVPPQNLDAEESVLGSMLLPGKHTIANIGDVLTSADFYRESHGTIFQTAVELDAKGDPVDALTLAAELERRGLLEKVGGKFRIHELASLAPAAANAVRYAEIVKEQAVRRQLIRTGSEISNLGWEGIGTLDELLHRAESHFRTATSTSLSGDFLPVGAELDGMMGKLTKAVETSTPITGLRTGLPKLDAMTTGFYPGQVIVVAARPGVGKSVLGQNIAENAADRGKPSAVFSLEMSREEVALRSIARKTGLPVKQVRTGSLTPEQLKQVSVAIEDLKAKPMFVDDNAGVSTTELRARARRLKAKHGLDILVVDYLQLMLATKSNESRQIEVAAISRDLKLLAKELEIPVIAISQLNRNVEYREDKRPTLADLRDSGAIEQDADMVIFLYREDTYKKVAPKDGRTTELILAKNRMMGETGTVYLQFIKRRELYTEPARHGEG